MRAPVRLVTGDPPGDDELPVAAAAELELTLLASGLPPPCRLSEAPSLEVFS